MSKDEFIREISNDWRAWALGIVAVVIAFYLTTGIWTVVSVLAETREDLSRIDERQQSFKEETLRRLDVIEATLRNGKNAIPAGYVAMRRGD